jgi:hypothetical protein
MFPALLAHPQEALHKQHLVYCLRVMSVGCYQGWSGVIEKSLFGGRRGSTIHRSTRKNHTKCLEKFGVFCPFDKTVIA